jgi:hypothetical protein
VEGSCEHGNERSGSVKYWEVLEQLSDWRLLKKDSTSWNWLDNYAYNSLYCIYLTMLSNQN